MRSNSRFHFLGYFAIPCLLALAAGPAPAVDGVIEINQQCAVATGCGPSDGAGFPVTLNVGSYRLTSDLDVTGEANPENVTAIEVNSTGVGGTTLDLNGFRIVGPTFCGGTPPSSCSPTGTGRGIDSNDNRITIRNGMILGMGDDGIHLISSGRVENMLVENCGGDGIEITGSGSFVAGNVSRRNGGNGIAVGGRGLVLNNLSHANIGDGLAIGGSSAYAENASTQNTGAQVSGAGIQIGDNLCENVLCP